MTYGIKTFSDDGYLNLHSDYSSLVYLGEMTQSVAPTRFIYTGDSAKPLSAATISSNYGTGFTYQVSFDTSSDFVVPFYLPSFDGQDVGIMDLVQETGVWKVNVVYSGASNLKPRLFLFGPISDLSDVAQNDYGLTVYNADSEIVFTDSKPPLRIDEVVTITHPSSIRTGSKGTCGNDASCDVNFTPDQSSTVSGSVNNGTSKLYAIIPSAYGGLAYSNSGTFRKNCGLFNLGNRNYAWGYQSWSSFRGSLRHPVGTSEHVASWTGDFAGKIHQENSGGCGVGGFLGAILGIVAVIAAVGTGGASLALLAVSGAVGFVVGTALGASTPSLRAYEEDTTLDTTNSTNLMITDASYYGIDSSAVAGTGIDGDGVPTGVSVTYVADYAPLVGYLVNTIWMKPVNTGVSAGVAYGGVVISDNIPNAATSYTHTDGYTYVREPEVDDSRDVFGVVVLHYHRVGRY